MRRGSRGDAADLTMRPANPGDEQAILLMRERSTGEQQDPQLWQWLFERNTSSSQLHCYVAEAGGTIVAQNATLPVRLAHQGREIGGLADLHAATDPAYQGRGLFTQLGEKLQMAFAAERPVVFAFPNPASSRIFYDQLGWTELAPFPVYLRPLGNTRSRVAERWPRLSPLAFIADRIAGLGLAPARMMQYLAERRGARVIRLHDFGEWTDRLWEGLRPYMETCAVRDAEFLRWRFCDSPFRYTIFGLDRGAGPVGFAVVSLRPGKLADVMELMVPSDDRTGARLLLAHSVRYAAAKGATALRAFVSLRHPHRAAFLQAGFIRLPRRLKRDYSFGVCVLDPSQVEPASVLHMENWYISGADLDYR